MKIADQSYCYILLQSAQRSIIHHHLKMRVLVKIVDTMKYLTVLMIPDFSEQNDKSKQYTFYPSHSSPA